MIIISVEYERNYTLFQMQLILEEDFMITFVKQSPLDYKFDIVLCSTLVENKSIELMNEFILCMDKVQKNELSLRYVNIKINDFSTRYKFMYGSDSIDSRTFKVEFDPKTGNVSIVIKKPSPTQYFSKYNEVIISEKKV